MSEETRNQYAQRHKMVKAVRGVASKRGCERCGNRMAKHWATAHGTDGSKPSHYIALCVFCHSLYDRASKRLWPV
jgi:hypothetical protein